MDKLLRGSEWFAQKTMTWSGLGPITDAQQRHAMATFANQTLHFAETYKTFDQIPRRMRDVFADIGMSPSDVNRVLEAFRDSQFIIKNERGTIAGFGIGKAEHYNILPQYFGAYRQRATNLIQSSKWSTLFPGMSGPWARAIFLLQSFSVASFKTQLVPNFQRAGRHGKRFMNASTWDGPEGQADALLGLSRVGFGLMGQMASGALMYALGRTLYEMNNDDEDKWNEIWDPTNLLLAGVSRAGWLAWAPLVWDSVAAPIVGKSLSGYRTSMQAPGIWDGPIWTTLPDMGKAVQAAYKLSATDDANTRHAQQMLRAVTNLWFAKAALNAAVRAGGLEEPAHRDLPPSFLEGFGAFEE